MREDDEQDQNAQVELLTTLTRIACAGTHCLESSSTSSDRWVTLHCTLCDISNSPGRSFTVYWDDGDRYGDWKDVIAAMIVITKEAMFQSSSKARILMAVAVGRLFNHISDPDYLNLDVCELGQWLLGSMSRSLRELKLAAT